MKTTAIDPIHKLRGATLLQSSSAGVLIAILILVTTLALTTHDYASIVNVAVVTEIVATTAIVGMAQMVIVGSGGMNLSVGAIGGLVGVATGGLMNALGVPPPLAILVGLAAGALCGLFNGWIITRLGVSGVVAFLVTLASGSVFTGVILGITKSVPFYNLPEQFKFMGNTRIQGIPLMFFIMLFVAFLVDAMFRRVKIGRQILALGGNIKAAELSGVPVHQVVIIAHMISGALAGFAGILLISRLGSAHPDVGKDWMLGSFAGPIIGGTRLAGGKVSVVGAVLGAILLALIANALVFLNIDVYWNTFIQGLIILSAVGLDRVRALSTERL